MMAEDVLKYVSRDCLFLNPSSHSHQYPKLLGSKVEISVIQSRDHILNTYSEKISQYAEKRFARNDVKIITNARLVWPPHSRGD